MKIFRLPLLAAALTLLAATALPAQDADGFRELGAAPAPAASAKPAKKAAYTSQPSKNQTTAKIAFSDKSKPGTLKVSLAAAEIDIEGTNRNEIVVTSSLDKKGAPNTDDDGYRRLDQEVAFELTEKDNVATLRIVGDNPWLVSGAEFKIQVPRSTNLSIKTHSGEGVEIDDIDGDIEVSTVNGEISLENITGSVVANTMSGKIDAEFKRAPKKPVSLTAMNGGITLAVPPATAANLRMRTMNGAIRTNFPENALKITTTASESATTAAKKTQMKITTDSTSGTTVVTSTDGGAHTDSTPSDSELLDAIVEARKAQAAAYADKGLAAAQKGIAAAMQAIDNIKGLSDEEKELIKRKIQSGGNAIPRSVRGITIPTVGGKTITGELNGGGVDIQLTTMNGGITVKQEK